MTNKELQGFKDGITDAMLFRSLILLLVLMLLVQGNHFESTVGHVAGTWG